MTTYLGYIEVNIIYILTTQSPDKSLGFFIGERSSEMKKVVYKTLEHEMKKNKMTLQSVADELNLYPPGVLLRLRKEIEWRKSEIDTVLKLFKKKYEYLFKEN